MLFSRLTLGTGDADKLIPKTSRGIFLTNDGVLFKAYWFDEATADAPTEHSPQASPDDVKPLTVPEEKLVGWLRQWMREATPESFEADEETASDLEQILTDCFRGWIEEYQQGKGGGKDE